MKKIKNLLVVALLFFGIFLIIEIGLSNPFRYSFFGILYSQATLLIAFIVLALYILLIARKRDKKDLENKKIITKKIIRSIVIFIIFILLILLARNYYAGFCYPFGVSSCDVG